MIVSTTLVGPGTLEVLDEALASVRGQVDAALIIATDESVTRRDVDHAARRARLREIAFYRFDWTNDFSAARNFALATAAAFATESGVDLSQAWALTLDTDERLHFDPSVGVSGFDLRKHLSRVTEFDVLLVPQVDGSYAKERLLRLSKPWRWTGRTHEALPWLPGTKRWTLDRVTFSELAKTPEQLRAKFERDCATLIEDLAGALPGPDNARGWYYLGESYHGLDDVEQAIFAFTTCAEFSGWNEEAAWARYRCADLECRRGQFDRAIEHAALGLTKHAGTAELGWIAGIAAFRAGRFEQAIHWATLSAAVGMFSGTGRGWTRTGFRYPPALWEGPYDVIWHAYDALGDVEQAARNRARRGAAEKLRLKVVDEPDAT